MQIGAKDIENLFDCGVEFFFGKDIFSFLFTWESIKQILFEIVQKMIYETQSCLT